MLTRISQQQHRITLEQLHPDAIKIATTLIEAGHEAYLVGGCIRDILLSKTPKDFDIATSAHPQQIQRLFKRCRLIGRRFRLAHVSLGKEIIEVATFRGPPEPRHAQTETHSLKSSDKSSDHAVSDAGLVIRDNCYGTLEDDVYRRDFSMNALYLDPISLEILDYVDGIHDINHQCIRLLGDADIRFREDPVRTLRAIRFEAKLGFKLHPDLENKLSDYLPLLDSVAPARRFEELLKFFLTGHAHASFEQLKSRGALGHLLPTLSPYLEVPTWKHLFRQALINTDDRIHLGKPVTPAFLLAVFIWPSVKQRKAQVIEQGQPPAIAVEQATHEILTAQSETTSVPKRFSLAIREIFMLQSALQACTLKRCENLLKQRRFRAAYDFLLLREQSGERPAGLGDWWTQYQAANISERKCLIEARRPKKGNKKHRTHEA